MSAWARASVATQSHECQQTGRSRCENGRIHSGYWECAYFDEANDVKDKIQGYLTLLPRTRYTADVYESLDRLFQYLAELLYDSYLVCLAYASQSECESRGGQCAWRHIPAYPPGAESGVDRCVPTGLRLDLGVDQPLQLLYPSEAAMTQRVEELHRIHPKAFDTPVGNGRCLAEGPSTDRDQVPLRVRAEAQFLAHALFERRFPDPETRLAAQREYEAKGDASESPVDRVLARVNQQWNQKVTEGVMYVADIRKHRDSLVTLREEVEREMATAETLGDSAILSELASRHATLEQEIARVDTDLERAMRTASPWVKHFLKFVLLVGTSFLVYYGYTNLASLSATATGLGARVAEYAQRAGRFLKDGVVDKAQALVREWYPAAGALVDIARKQLPMATTTRELAAPGLPLNSSAAIVNGTLGCPRRQKRKKMDTECLTQP